MKIQTGKYLLRKIVSAVVALAVALSMMVVFDVPEKISATAEGTHSHKLCEGSEHDLCVHGDIVYEPFPSGLNIITSDANYYLTEDLTDDTLIYDIFIENATVNLCLNGHTVITERKGFKVCDNGVLNICDCKTGGCMTNTLYTEGVAGAGGNGTLNIYSGKFSGEKGGGISTGENSVVNIYGGEITSAEADCIWLRTGSTLSIYGGTVKSTTDKKDGIYTFGNTKINVNGGTIIGKRYGIRLDKGNNTVNINGGTVIGTDNAAVYSKSGDTVNINGGNISSEESTACVLNYGTMNISGGTFSGGADNYIHNYGSFSLQGSPTLVNTSIWLCNDNNIAINGALTNSEAYSVYVSSGVPRIFTSGWDTHMSDSSVSKYFRSPYSYIKIACRDGEAAKVYYYKITYDANGGSCLVKSAEADASDKLTSLAVPTREGCSFDGWFTEETGGEQVTTDTVFTDDATIYAHWTCDHNWGDTYEKDENQHWKVCSKCGAEGEKTEHQWDIGEMTKQPTEDEAGVMLYTCTVCGAEKMKDIDKSVHTHTYSDEWTCDEANHWHAAACGHDVKSGLAEHNFGEPTVTPSVCTKQGSEEYVCQTCGYKKTVSLDLAKHSFDGEWQKDGDCHWKVCTICNTAKSSIAVHSWNDGTVTKQPTADANGEKTFECTVCGKTKTETIPATDEPSNPDSGNISIDVQPGENAPDTKLKTPFDELVYAVLTHEEQEKVKEGIDIKIILTVEDAGESVPDADRTAVEEALKELSGCKLGQYLDVSLIKTVGKESQRISGTYRPVRITFEIPESLRGSGRVYSVIRVHNGEAAVLEDIDSVPDTLTIETDCFSTYAIVFYGEEGGMTEPPATGAKPIAGICAAFGAAALVIFMLIYFTTGRNGLSEEKKTRIFNGLIAWGKSGKWLRAHIALALIFLILGFYYSIGRKTTEDCRTV